MEHNKENYSINKMCKSLKISRSKFYYKMKLKIQNTELENEIVKIFKDSYENYGSRKIKNDLDKINVPISRSKIREIMIKDGLKSSYCSGKCNEDKIENIVNREFNGRKDLEVLVSDLTYVRVGNAWNYICIIMNLYNRAIVGFAVAENKDSKLVSQAFMSSKINLSKVQIFHTDRGSEFKNSQIDELLHAFKIKRSLSRKANPWDNAVAESLYKILKTEFIDNTIFSSQWQLQRELTDYINWYNKKRLHSSLNYVAPLEY